VTPQELLERLRWRYATKKFDPTRKIDADTWAALEHSLLLSPSSYGLQPWKFLVIDDRAVREALLPLTWNQRQVVDASHYVVFAARKDVAATDVERWMARLAEVRGIGRETLAGYERAMTGFVAKPPTHVVLDDWTARQTYIALGFAMEAAALLGVDTCAMEGLEPAKYDAVLGLDGRGYRTICALALGYRAADDRNATNPKARFALGDVVEHV
jgi:nitroreductase